VSAPRTALISCLRLLGDVVLSLPLVDMIKSEHPNCEVDYLVPASYSAFLRCDPRIRRVIEHQRGGPSYIPKILMRYDWSFGFENSDRTAISVALSGVRKRVSRISPGRPVVNSWKYLALTSAAVLPPFTSAVRRTIFLAREAGLNPTRCRAIVHWASHHESVVSRLLDDNAIPPQGHFVMHPFSQYPYKEWGLDRVAAASDRISERYGLRPVWTGSASARDRQLLEDAAARTKVTPVLCAGTLDLNSVTCLVARARLYIGVDTGITHFAATTGTPLVALFGPTDTHEWAPWNNERGLDYEFPRQPGSFRNGHISVLQNAEARLRTGVSSVRMDQPNEAMAAISVDEVVAEADYQLANASVHSPA
jgi:heptosyltransferase-3